MSATLPGGSRARAQRPRRCLRVRRTPRSCKPDSVGGRATQNAHMQITTALQSDARTPVRRRGGGAGRRPGACPDAARGVTTIVVPQAAGGAVDIGARAMAEFLSTAKATPTIVVNKPGAAGEIAASFVAGASPDGATLLMGNSSTMVVAPQGSRRRATTRRRLPPFGRHPAARHHPRGEPVARLPQPGGRSQLHQPCGARTDCSRS